MSSKESIRLFPDPILRKPAEPVIGFDVSLRSAIKKMQVLMKTQRHGIGIAAPQIGISRRIAIVDVSERVETARRLILINPEILGVKDEIVTREGCMSIPDYTAHTKRHNFVRVIAQDETGQWFLKEAVGIEAVCIQHEVDHLNGKLFIDHVTSLLRDMIPRPKNFRSSSNH